MPEVSDSLGYGNVGTWNVKVGDKVGMDEPLVEIETEDVVIDFEAPEDGFVAKILVPSGSKKVPTGEVLALIVNSEDDIEAARKEDEEPIFKRSDVEITPPDSHQADNPETNIEVNSSQQNKQSSTPASTGQTRSYTSMTFHNHNGTRNVFKHIGSRYFSSGAALSPNTNPQAAGHLSPAAHHLVIQHNIDVSSLRGTGKGGRVSKYDVVNQLDGKTVTFLTAASADKLSDSVSDAFSKQDPKTTGSMQRRSPSGIPQMSRIRRLGQISRTDPTEAYEEVKHTNMRKVIASRLTQSKTTIPHAYASQKCNIDELLKVKQSLKDRGAHTSLNDFVIRAAALALRDVPRANAFWDVNSDSVQETSSIDISVAVATDGGLITPIVKNVDRKSVAQINSNVKELASRARDGGLDPEEFNGGSFTISNLGMFGIDSFSAVINPPQACILAISSGVKNVSVPQNTDHLMDLISNDSETDECGVHNPNTTANTTDSGTEERLESTEDTKYLFISTFMDVCLSSDRRVVDEITAGEFLTQFQRYIENPTILI